MDIRPNLTDESAEYSLAGEGESLWKRRCVVMGWHIIFLSMCAKVSKSKSRVMIISDNSQEKRLLAVKNSPPGERLSELGSRALKIRE